MCVYIHIYIYIYTYICLLSHFIHVQLSVTLWSIAHQGPLHGTLQVRISEWAALPYSRGSS